MSEDNQESHGYTDLPTQVAFSRRASWRTFIQALVAFIPTANGMLLALQSALNEQPFQSALPGWVFLATNAAVVVGAFLAKVAAQLMANAVVNDWLERRTPQLGARDPR